MKRPLDLKDGLFRVSCCENDHVTLEVLDGEGLTVFLCVMSGEEAFGLARDLVLAAED